MNNTEIGLVASAHLKWAHIRFEMLDSDLVRAGAMSCGAAMLRETGASRNCLSRGNGCDELTTPRGRSGIACDLKPHVSIGSAILGGAGGGFDGERDTA